MHIISKKALQDFWEKHPTAASPLQTWFTVVRQAKWRNLADVRRDFPAADLVGRLMVFNIGGNNYRLVARVEYEWQRVYVRHVLTHAEYDKERWKHDDWNS
ncbi:MAG: type II toxin-antitoxin system HigB family toxin [Chloroflexi bacterium]|nr:type II toxin-antitoxin system HigB family toxin [Chloroflexota bacterium]